MHYIGVDHHKQYSHLTVLAEDGSVVKEGRVLNLRAEIERFLEMVGEGSEAVIEAGRATYTMTEVLEELGLGVKIAHPQEVKAIAHAWIKTDKRDSEILAHLSRMDMIPEVYQREEVRLEAERFSHLFSREGMKFLKALDLAATDQELPGALLKSYDHLEERIKESDELVKRLHREMREAQLIDTVPGLATFLSVLVAVEIGDIKRFPRVENFHAYAGVIPSTHSSGEKNYHGRIIKAGNRWLCWALVEAVYPALKVDHDLWVFYERISRRKGANPAKVATARRLLTIIYKMLKEGRPYVPYKR